jgi:hypothetical protein
MGTKRTSGNVRVKQTSRRKAATSGFDRPLADLTQFSHDVSFILRQP